MIDGTLRESSHSDSFEMSLFSFEYMLELLPPEKPLLILINKQDLVQLNPLSAEEAVQIYPINKLINRSINVIATSAKYGEGVDQALKWLVSKLGE